ncbi:MAG: hypothetical protein M2R45_01236 [Verrucomicrobia subdivision 3 bacterium]|nr:hypothetical protein [Limisphaerales bacterium]MCS1415212.1 hypothetical protein [Limisphaerales bacterium]
MSDKTTTNDNTLSAMRDYISAVCRVYVRMDLKRVLRIENRSYRSIYD